MTRQVAIAALIAFAATVLVLSIWSPSQEAPAAVTAPAPAPVPTRALPGGKRLANEGLDFRRSDRLNGLVVNPAVAARLGLAPVDAGTP